MGFRLAQSLGRFGETGGVDDIIPIIQGSGEGEDKKSL